MNTYIIGEADRIHVKGEYFEGKKVLRCSNCGQRGISTFDKHCNGCGFFLNRIDDYDGVMRICHTPPIKEVDELPDFTKNWVVLSEEMSEKAIKVLQEQKTDKTKHEVNETSNYYSADARVFGD